MTREYKEALGGELEAELDCFGIGEFVNQRVSGFDVIITSRKTLCLLSIVYNYLLQSFYVLLSMTKLELPRS